MPLDFFLSSQKGINKSKIFLPFFNRCKKSRIYRNLEGIKKLIFMFHLLIANNIILMSNKTLCISSGIYNKAAKIKSSFILLQSI